MWRRATAAAATLAVALLVLGVAPAGAVAQLRIQPASGPPGTPLTITGTGFTNGAAVEVHLDDQAGPLLGTATGPDFSLTATVPDAPAGSSHPVIAITRSGTSTSTVSTTFRVSEATPTTTTTVPPTTEAPAVTAPATTTTAVTRATTPGAGATRGGFGVDGGVGISTTTGEEAPVSSGGNAGATGAAASTTTLPGDPSAAAGGTGAPGATGQPGAPADPNVGAPGPDGGNALAVGRDGRPDEAALRARPTSKSGQAPRAALVAIGLGVALLGVAFLAVRNRRAPASADFDLEA